MAELLRKRSWEIRLMTVDMEPALGDASISGVDSVTVTVVGTGSAVTVSSIEYTDTQVSFLASAGADGKDYTVRIRVNSAGTRAQRLEAVLKLEVRDTDP